MHCRYSWRVPEELTPSTYVIRINMDAGPFEVVDNPFSTFQVIETEGDLPPQDEE